MKNLLLISVLTLSINAFCQVPSYVPSDSLLAWWGFNGNAIDQSGNGYDGTINGATLTNDRFGNNNSAFEFDGIDDDISTSNLAALNNCQKFTYSVWLKRAASCEQYARIMGQSSFSGQQSFSTRIQFSGSTLQPSIRNGANTYASGGSVSNDIWYHLVLTYDGEGLTNSDKVKLFVNNVPVNLSFPNGQNDIPDFTYSGNDPFYLGWDIAQNITSGHFGGALDDVGIWNRVLSTCEIQDLFDAQLGVINTISQTDVTLTADQNNATYQWLDCDNNNSPITGETAQSYTPTVTGNYAVEVTLNGCSTISECTLVDFTGVNEISKPKTKKLLRIVNLLGQEVECTPNTVLIYMYSDGTSEKVFNVVH